jgi:hypothetical protein
VNKKKSKYNNEKVEVDGIIFDSKKEERYYQDLKLLKKAGEVKDFTLQPEFVPLKGFTHQKSGQKVRPIILLNHFRLYIL